VAASWQQQYVFAAGRKSAAEATTAVLLEIAGLHKLLLDESMRWLAHVYRSVIIAAYKTCGSILRCHF